MSKVESTQEKIMSGKIKEQPIYWDNFSSMKQQEELKPSLSETIRCIAEATGVKVQHKVYDSLKRDTLSDLQTLLDTSNVLKFKLVDRIMQILPDGEALNPSQVSLSLIINDDRSQNSPICLLQEKNPLLNSQLIGFTLIRHDSSDAQSDKLFITNIYTSEKCLGRLNSEDILIEVKRITGIGTVSAIIDRKCDQPESSHPLILQNLSSIPTPFDNQPAPNQWIADFPAHEQLNDLILSRAKNISLWVNEGCKDQLDLLKKQGLISYIIQSIKINSLNFNWYQPLQRNITFQNVFVKLNQRTANYMKKWAIQGPCQSISTHTYPHTQFNNKNFGNSSDGKQSQFNNHIMFFFHQKIINLSSYIVSSSSLYEKQPDTPVEKLSGAQIIKLFGSQIDPFQESYQPPIPLSLQGELTKEIKKQQMKQRENTQVVFAPALSNALGETKSCPSQQVSKGFLNFIKDEDKTTTAASSKNGKEITPYNQRVIERISQELIANYKIHCSKPPSTHLELLAFCEKNSLSLLEDGLPSKQYQDEQELASVIGNVILNFRAQARIPEGKSKILIVSPSNSSGSHLFQDLLNLNLIKEQQKQANTPKIFNIDNSLPICTILGSKQLDQIATHEDFLIATNNIEVIILNSILIFDKIMRQIIKLEDFSLVIFEDISQMNDARHQWIMEDYFPEIQDIQKKPLILTLFTQKPRVQVQLKKNNFHSWLTQTCQQFQSKLVKVENKYLLKLKNPEMCELLMQAQAKMPEIISGIQIRTKSLKPPNEWLKVPNGGAMITARDALNELKIQFAIMDNYVPKNADLNFSDEDDKLRKSKEPYTEVTNQVGKGVTGHRGVRALVPLAFKKFLNDVYCQPDQEITTLKADAIGIMCLKIMSQMIEFDILNKHLMVNKEQTILLLNPPAKEEFALQSPRSLQEYPEKINGIKNSYIQQSFNLQKQMKVQVAVCDNVSQYPFQNTHGVAHTIGFLMPPGGFTSEINNLGYQIQIDAQTRQQHIEHLVDSGRAQNFQEAFNMTEHQSNLLDYHLETTITLDNCTPELLQKLKLFHVWSFYSLLNMEPSFFRALLKCKYSFSEVLFGSQIDHVTKRYPMLMAEFTKERERYSTYNWNLDEAHIYMIPIFIKKGKYQVNFSAIEGLVRHLRMQIINNCDKSIQLQMPSGLYKMDLDEVRGQMWNQSSNYKMIKGNEQVNERMWNNLSFTQIPKVNRIQYQEKGDRLTLPQFFVAHQSVHLDRKNTKQFYKFAKAPGFIDCAAVKTTLAFMRENEEDRKNLEEALESEFNNQDSSQYKMTPAQLIEVFPVPYELFSVLQHACSHFQKLNDFLRTQAFIEKFYPCNDEFPSQKVEGNLFDFQNIHALGNKGIQQQKLQKEEEVKSPTPRDQLLGNLPLITTALTAPATQLLENNERLKTYGDALMQIIFITDCYLNRAGLDTEQDLDTKRKAMNSKDHFSFLNLKHGIHNYMLTEPLSHLPTAVKPDDSVSKLTQMAGIRNNTVHRNVVPGGLQGQYFLDKQKNIRKANLKHKLFNLKAIIETEKKQQKQQDQMQSLTRDFDQICEVLKLLLVKKGWRKQFQNSLRLQSIRKTVLEELKQHRDQPLNKDLIEYLATLLITTYDLNLSELRLIFYELTFEKLMKTGNLCQFEEIKKQPHAFSFNIVGISSEFQKKSNQALIKQQPMIKKPKIHSANALNMELKVQKDNKLGETVEALFAAISMQSGVQEGYEFLRKIGVVNNELSLFVEKIKDNEINQQTDNVGKIINGLIVQSRVEEVQELINYEFQNKQLLMRAFLHPSFCDSIEKEQKVKLPNYNLLEFLGDSVMNFFVVDFFYRHSNNSPYLKSIYGHDQLHKLKTELTNNNFLSMMMIEMGLHNYILKKERVSFNVKFDTCINTIQELLYIKDKKKKYIHHVDTYTYEQYAKFYKKGDFDYSPDAIQQQQSPMQKRIPGEVQQNFNSNLEFLSQDHIPDAKAKNLAPSNFLKQLPDAIREFLHPEVMKQVALQSENQRVSQEDLDLYQLKIFADVFEALIGAVFIDSGCNFTATQKVFMRLFESYLYYYGNTQTTQEHPKTETLHLWSQGPFGKIKGFPIKITNSNVVLEQSGRTLSLYKGYVGGTEVMQIPFELHEKNKAKRFYRLFHYFVQDLLKHLKVKFPNFENLSFVETAARAGTVPDQEETLFQTEEDAFKAIIAEIREYRIPWNHRLRDAHKEIESQKDKYFIDKLGAQTREDIVAQEESQESKQLSDEGTQIEEEKIKVISISRAYELALQLMVKNYQARESGQ